MHMYMYMQILHTKNTTPNQREKVLHKSRSVNTYVCKLGRVNNFQKCEQQVQFVIK